MIQKPIAYLLWVQRVVVIIVIEEAVGGPVVLVTGVNFHFFVGPVDQSPLRASYKFTVDKNRESEISIDRVFFLLNSYVDFLVDFHKNIVKARIVEHGPDPDSEKLRSEAWIFFARPILGWPS